MRDKIRQIRSQKGAVFDQEILASQASANRFPFPHEGEISLAVRNANYDLGPMMLHLVMNSGRWRIINHFSDGSEVDPDNARVLSPTTPASDGPQTRFGDLPMYVHSRSGKIALARSEVAD